MTDLGGEPPCWAHIVDDLDNGPASPRSRQGDATPHGDRSVGADRSVPHDGEFAATPIELDGGEGLGEQVDDGDDDVSAEQHHSRR